MRLIPILSKLKYHFKMKATVVKCGGAVATEAADTILALAAEGQAVCVVHGAGPQITAELRRRGLAVDFVDGRRVTTAEALDVVRRELATVNAALCEAIGDRAIGLMGDELGLRATQVAALGLVGDPEPYAPPRLRTLMDAGHIPVVSPLARGPLNVNGDEAAAALALGLRAERIVFLTDVEGLFVDGALASAVRTIDADRLLASRTLQGGIVPKLRAAVTATRGGVRAEIGATLLVA
jgi:acetylglutamate kinase